MVAITTLQGWGRYVFLIWMEWLSQLMVLCSARRQAQLKSPQLLLGGANHPLPFSLRHICICLAFWHASHLQSIRQQKKGEGDFLSLFTLLLLFLFLLFLCSTLSPSWNAKPAIMSPPSNEINSIFKFPIYKFLFNWECPISSRINWTYHSGIASSLGTPVYNGSGIWQSCAWDFVCQTPYLRAISSAQSVWLPREHEQSNFFPLTGQRMFLILLHVISWVHLKFPHLVMASMLWQSVIYPLLTTRWKSLQQKVMPLNYW